MRVPLLIALLATAALPALPAAASAPTGTPCTFNAVSWDTVAPGQWHTVIRGGTAAAPDAAGVSVTCEIHVDDAVHSGPAAATATSATTPGAAALEPRAVVVAAGEFARLYACTSATVDGTRWYYTHGNDGGTWTTSSSATCATSLTWPDEVPEEVRYVVGAVLCLTPARSRTSCDVIGPLLDRAGLLIEEVDAALCPELAALAPGHDPVTIEPDGDVYLYGELWWDCPPYENTP